MRLNSLQPTTMGNSASKAVKTAAQASKRQYPTRIPPVSTKQSTNSPTQITPGPQVHTPERASEIKTDGEWLEICDICIVTI